MIQTYFINGRGAFNIVQKISRLHISLIGSLCTCSFTNKTFGVTWKNSLNDLIFLYMEAIRER